MTILRRNSLSTTGACQTVRSRSLTHRKIINSCVCPLIDNKTIFFACILTTFNHYTYLFPLTNFKPNCSPPQGRKIATGTISPSFVAHGNIYKVHKNVQERLKIIQNQSAQCFQSRDKYCKKWLSLYLGLQGIVVRCTAASFFLRWIAIQIGPCGRSDWSKTHVLSQ